MVFISLLLPVHLLHALKNIEGLYILEIFEKYFMTVNDFLVA